ncbi:hypothetical protein EES37_09735 [Streptomyces sp. ADI91-18]|uniref:hypothetical protein n=1 Tax=Streptomyces sp. ADI91-18 TaxID=1522755 RepID=UPI000F554955|nr:hypothetical protein [Streptomyces sp. ADI91-18]RPK47877.1 hypothetical protein EES37_09735 [Streptomyces sp. ADI91-18]
MLARVRATAGRVATVAGAVLLTGGLGNDAVTLPGAAAAVVTAGVGLAVNPKAVRAPTSVRWTAISLYTGPHAGCVVLLVGERLAPDTGLSLLVQAAVAALWTGATWLLRPGLTARQFVDEALAQELAEAQKVEEEPPVEPSAPTYDSPQARWWGERIAIEGGAAPGTVLLEHRQVSEQCLALIIGAQERGQPVEIAKPGLSAELDLPEELIDIGPVPGRGAGVRLLVLGQRPLAGAGLGDSDAEVWAEIAATAMPGVELIEANTYEMPKELT